MLDNNNIISSRKVVTKGFPGVQANIYFINCWTVVVGVIAPLLLGCLPRTRSGVKFLAKKQRCEDAKF